MKNKVLVPLVLTSVGLLLVIVLVLVLSPKGGAEKDKDKDKARSEPPTQPGTVVEKAKVPDPPPPPKPVNNPDRIRQNLKPGKTYVTHTKGVLNVRGEDKDWGVATVVTINFAFEAWIDRQIESNDGKRIVELRHFRDVRSAKIVSRLEDIRLELGPIASQLIPESLRGYTNGQPALALLRAMNISPERLAGMDEQNTKLRQKVDGLNGKSVRITYVDGEGVTSLEPVQGEMTTEERNLHLDSILVSDSLIIPDVDVKIGNRWSVDGRNFGNLIDPGLLARVRGEVTLERAPDHITQGKTCRNVTAVTGRLLLDDSTNKEGRIGHFEPRGSLYFSTEDQVIIEASLKGKASLEHFSKDHLLFESRMRHQPEMDVLYTCRITDTLK